MAEGRLYIFNAGEVTKGAIYSCVFPWLNFGLAFIGVDEFFFIMTGRGNILEMKFICDCLL